MTTDSQIQANIFYHRNVEHTPDDFGNEEADEAMRNLRWGGLFPFGAGYGMVDQRQALINYAPRPDEVWEFLMNYRALEGHPHKGYRGEYAMSSKTLSWPRRGVLTLDAYFIPSRNNSPEMARKFREAGLHWFGSLSRVLIIMSPRLQSGARALGAEIITFRVTDRNNLNQVFREEQELWLYNTPRAR